MKECNPKSLQQNIYISIMPFTITIIKNPKKK